jgi:chitinase
MPINENIWVNAYLASWEHEADADAVNSTRIKTSEIDWDAMTHMTYFSLNIASDGTPSQPLDGFGNFNSERLNSIVPAAHAHNVKIIFSVGGGGSFEGFRDALMSVNRDNFIQTIHDVLSVYGFDGVNLSMPPFINDTLKTDSENELDYANYRMTFQAFISELYESFNEFKTLQDQRPLITLGALKDTEMIAVYQNIQKYCDQINILTYDMAQPWRGWQAWHNSALYNERVYFNDNDFLKLPSVDDKVNEFIDAGIERLKIGIAINFYATEWRQVNLYDTWPAWPTQDMSIYSNPPYKETVEKYNLNDAEWDGNAHVPFLNVDTPQAFVSFENDASIDRKVNYAKRKRIGGVMIWELGGAFFPDRSAEHKDPLLKSVKKHAFNPN